MHTLILATRNQGKIREIRSILLGLPLEIKSLLEFPHLPEIVEDGSTFEENALKKARNIFALTRSPTLSDDSGLEVFSLRERPGVLSARYAGEHVSYDANNKKLLAELKGFPVDQRRAQFRCVAAFVGDEIEKIVEGVCHGTIIDEPRGSGGFGYDPIFIPDGYQTTFAELPLHIKNHISHR
ncbi:MAG: RdgB/HAM1 family non-canonical purine NTP pyrophosphatase, partial [Ignavibacteriae bacterium]|nr:RdgB/HAM1 family non-canonical purine NTP pyrophosphatase [Ignavibacteriota bacterium]